MKLDLEYVREYYGSLTDEALLAVDRSDLVEMAQQCYDGEISRRGLARPRRFPDADNLQAAPVLPDYPLEVGAGREAPGAGGKPAWADDAAEAYSVVVTPRDSELRAADACEVLEKAGIPCYSEMIELTPEEKQPSPGTHRWRIMVPRNLSWRAMSTLAREFSNPDFEAGWKAHLETISDKDIPAMHPKIVFCGLYDRIERATRVYEEEMARRRRR